MEEWGDGNVARHRTARATTESTRQLLLRHVMVVGGTLAEWDDLGRERWSTARRRTRRRRRRCGAHVPDAAGVRAGGRPGAICDRWERRRRRRATSSSTRAVTGVSASPRRCGDCRPDEPSQRGDGRRGAVRAGRLRTRPDRRARCSRHSLPPSLVWELAYGELVFHPDRVARARRRPPRRGDRRLRRPRAPLRRARRCDGDRRDRP